MMRDPFPFLEARFREDELELDRLVRHLETSLIYWVQINVDRAWWGTESVMFIAFDHRHDGRGHCWTCADLGPSGLKEPREYPCLTLQALTWPYSTHEDYDDEWSGPRRIPR